MEDFSIIEMNNIKKNNKDQKKNNKKDKKYRNNKNFYKKKEIKKNLHYGNYKRRNIRLNKNILEIMKEKYQILEVNH